MTHLKTPMSCLIILKYCLMHQTVIMILSFYHQHFFLVFLYSFYSKARATIFDIPITAVVINTTTTTIPGKAKYDSKPYL
jgi:hypothetical protein